MLRKQLYDNIAEMRKAAGLDIKGAALLFGYTEQAWRNKESVPDKGKLSPAELMVLQMMGDTHPEYRMIPRNKRQER